MEYKALSTNWVAGIFHGSVLALAMIFLRVNKLILYSPHSIIQITSMWKRAFKKPTMPLLILQEKAFKKQ